VIAPSTPPPACSDVFAAFTIASTDWVVMSPSTSAIRTISGPSYAAAFGRGE
jgi:hypothetical protein